MPSSSVPTRRDWLTDAGLLVAALAAITSSGAALAGLARLAGWPAWLALMLPATIDLYAITATRVWLSRQTVTDKMRRYAAANALAGIGASVVGNAAYHALVAGAFNVPRWVLIVAVSMIPPTVIGALAHLVALRTREGEVRQTTSTRSGSRSADRTAEARTNADRSGTDQPGRSMRTARARTATPDRAMPEQPAALGGPADADQWTDAIAAYRTSVEQGEPLSERKLADRYGQSRRWARKVMDTARVDDATTDTGSADTPRLTLAASQTSGGAT